MKKNLSIYFICLFNLFLLTNLSSQNIQVDASFGDQGMYQLSEIERVGPGTPVVYPNKDILLTFNGYNNGTQTSRISRLDPFGQPVTSWGMGGSVMNIHQSMDHVRLLSDESIVYSITFNTGEKDIYYLLKLKPDGSVDENFGEGGALALPFKLVGVSDIHILPNDDILIAGGNYIASNKYPFMLCKLDKNGKWDLGFADNGILTLNNYKYQHISKIHVTVDQKIVLAGDAGDDFTGYFASRYDMNGTPDLTFGQNGHTVVYLDNGLNSKANSSVIDKDGNIIISGYLDEEAFTPAMVRITPSGLPDLSFGYNSIVMPDAYKCFSFHHLVTSFDDGSYMLMTGASLAEDDVDAEFNYTFIKINNNGTVDQTFGKKGFMEFDFDESFEMPINYTIDGNIMYMTGESFTGDNENQIIKFVLEESSSVKMLPTGYSFDIYPSVTSDHVFVQANVKTSSPAFINVFDVHGREVIKSNINLTNTSKNKIDLSTLSGGAYFVKIQVGKIIETHKVIKL